MTGVELIAKERERQQRARFDGGENWGPHHDDFHRVRDAMACAAAVYAMPQRFRKTRKPGLWKWARGWYKPCPNDRIRELEKAGALIAAEIDRLLRQQITDPKRKTQ